MALRARRMRPILAPSTCAASQTNALPAAPPASLAGPFPAPIRLIHFPRPGQTVAPGADHGPPPLRQPAPNRAVAPQTQHALHAQSTHAVLLIHHVPHGRAPGTPRQLGVGEERAGGHGESVPAATATVERGRHRPHFGFGTARTLRALRPADWLQERRPARSPGNQSWNSVAVSGWSSMPHSTTDCG